MLVIAIPVLFGYSRKFELNVKELKRFVAYDILKLTVSFFREPH